MMRSCRCSKALQASYIMTAGRDNDAATWMCFSSLFMSDTVAVGVLACCV